jgi:multiple sugar transport system ATP-binding protein
VSTLELRGLRKTHADGTRAVDGIDLDVADGEFFVLVGPSGCGKTATLRMIAGLDPVTDGTVLLDGSPINDVPVNARDVAMVFQDNVLYPTLTVADNIAFALRLAKVERAEIAQRVAHTANLLQVGHLLDRYPSQLSGGQRQRVAMGRAIIRTPRLLLMDEPMSNLDAKLRTETRFQILSLHRLLAVTTVYVTHDQVEAMAMGDRAAVMRDGRVVQCGTPLELYDDPADLFVAQFIGAPPMNAVAATITTAGERPAVRIGRHVVALDERVVARIPGLLDMLGRKVALGFRPEAARRDPDGPFVVSAEAVEPRGIDQLVTARFDASAVVQTSGGITVSEDACSTVHVALPIRDRIDLWRPIPLSLDASSICLFDLASGRSLDRLSTTCRPSTTSYAR